MVNIVEIQNERNRKDLFEKMIQTRLIQYNSFEQYKDEFKEGIATYQTQNSLPRTIKPMVIEESNYHIKSEFIDAFGELNEHCAYILNCNYGLITS